MYSSILQTSMYLLEIDSAEWILGESASGGCVVANGYRILGDATDSLKCVEYVDEKRTISAYYHEKSRSGARVMIVWRDWKRDEV